MPNAGTSITNILLSPDFQRLRAELTQVLARYPEARAEVAAVFPSLAPWRRPAARQACWLLNVPIGVSFTFASTPRSQRDEHATEHENSFDNLLCRSARVECFVPVRYREPIPFVFFGGIFGSFSRSARGDARQPRQGTRARAPESRGR